jgi:hypothetical protein
MKENQIRCTLVLLKLTVYGRILPKLGEILNEILWQRSRDVRTGFAMGQANGFSCNMPRAA